MIHEQVIKNAIRHNLSALNQVLYVLATVTTNANANVERERAGISSVSLLNLKQFLDSGIALHQALSSLSAMEIFFFDED
jgi:hypothetical protein